MRASLPVAAHLRRRAISLVVLIAFAWRVFGLDRQSLWRDEVDSISFALQELPALLSMFVRPGHNGSLYFLALRPWLRLVGTSEFALRYPSALAGVLSIPLLWQVARSLLPAAASKIPASHAASFVTQESPAPWHTTLSYFLLNPALLAALMFALSPYQLWYAQEGKMYTLTTLVVLSAAWFWLRAVGRGGWQPWLGLLIVVSAGIYIHLLTALLVPLLVVWFFLAWPQSKSRWLGFILVIAGLTLPYLPLAWWQWSLLTASPSSSALHFVPLNSIVSSLLLYHSHSIVPPAHALVLIPFIALVAFGLLFGPRHSFPQPAGRLPRLGAGRKHLLVASWALVPVGAIYLVSLRYPLFLPRYVIWIAPALMMLMAAGLRFLWQASHERVRPLLILLLIFLLGYWGYVGWRQKTATIKSDLRSAVGYVFERRLPEELLILHGPQLESSYRYYSSKQDSNPFTDDRERLGRWTEGPWTNNEVDETRARLGLDQEMRHKIGGAASFWVMRSETDMWDARDLFAEWLDNNATLVDVAVFHGVEVRLYRK